MIKNMMSKMLEFGPNIEFRNKVRIRQALNMFTVTGQDTQENKAKELVTNFLSKTTQLMDFKCWLYDDFLKHIFKINAQMRLRLDTHDLKMAHLNDMFERELK